MPDVAGVWLYHSSDVIADPGSGYLRLSADRDRAAISDRDRPNGERGAELLTLGPGSVITLQSVAMPDEAAGFTVTALTDHGTWIEYGVAEGAATPGTSPPTTGNDLFLTGEAATITASPSTPGTEFLPDSVSPEDAAELVALARQVLNAALWPNELPDDPLPAPLEMALAIVTRRLYDYAAAGSARPVVSESLGSYSYRLADPASVEGLLGSPVADLLGPWLPVASRTAYDVRTPSAYRAALPYDWFQRDLDNWLAAADEGASV